MSFRSCSAKFAPQTANQTPTTIQFSLLETECYNEQHESYGEQSRLSAASIRIKSIPEATERPTGPSGTRSACILTAETLFCGAILSEYAGKLTKSGENSEFREGRSELWCILKRPLDVSGTSEQPQRTHSTAVRSSEKRFSCSEPVDNAFLTAPTRPLMAPLCRFPPCISGFPPNTPYLDYIRSL